MTLRSVPNREIVNRKICNGYIQSYRYHTRTSEYLMLYRVVPICIGVPRIKVNARYTSMRNTLYEWELKNNLFFHMTSGQYERYC